MTQRTQFSLPRLESERSTRRLYDNPNLGALPSMEFSFVPQTTQDQSRKQECE